MVCYDCPIKDMTGGPRCEFGGCPIGRNGIAPVSICDKQNCTQLRAANERADKAEQRYNEIAILLDESGLIPDEAESVEQGITYLTNRLRQAERERDREYQWAQTYRDYHARALVHQDTLRAQVDALTKEIKALHKREAVSARELHQLTRAHDQRGQTIAHLEGKLRTSNTDRDTATAQVEMLAGALKATRDLLQSIHEGRSELTHTSAEWFLSDIDAKLSSLPHAGERWQAMVAQVAAIPALREQLLIAYERIKEESNPPIGKQVWLEKTKQALDDLEKAVGS